MSENKYGAIKVSAAGYTFASKLEKALYDHLMNDKNVELLQVQDTILLTQANIKYIPDFRCKNLTTGEIFWAEAKGYESERWPTIKKLWKFYGPGRLQVWKGKYAKLLLAEEIVSKSLTPPSCGSSSPSVPCALCGSL